MKQKYPLELKEYEQAHGHICFGLAIGYRAARMARMELALESIRGTDDVTVLTGGGDCVKDGIRLVTPCTCSLGGHFREGPRKFVFTFYYRKLNRAVRISVKPEAMQGYREIAVLKAKIKQKRAGGEEIRRFWELNEEEVKKILKISDNDLFELERFDLALLVKLNPFEGVYVPRALCDCGGQAVAEE